MLKIREYLTNFLLFLSLFYFTFYIPMSFATYNSYWYKKMCNYHSRCEKFGVDKINDKIDELTGYFLHKTDSLDKWTRKEKFHLNEVKGMLDNMFVLAIISLVFLLINYKKVKKLRTFSKINIFIILSFFLVLPFFKTFWREVFHPLLFDNDMWKNNRLDVSYYIMPRTFFKITVGFIFLVWLFLNTAIFFTVKNRFNNSPD